MCGISAILSRKKQNACDIVYGALKQLQNRGYDSMGIGTIIDGEIVVSRTMSMRLSIPDADICIGHTRWATHGARTINNAHPHTSVDQMFSLVHNGIIENYAELKSELVEIYGACAFQSETDSEVIANMLMHQYEKDKDIIRIIEKVCKRLSGTYGLAIIHRDSPDVIYLVRRGSPLLVGENDNYVMAASEMSGFDGQLTHYTPIPSECVTIMRRSGVDILGPRMMCVEKCVKSCEPYPHWMLKEIIEQPITLMQTINNGARIYGNKIHLGGLHIIRDVIPMVTHIVLLGCGTSLYACMSAVYYFRRCVPRAHITACDAAEFSVEAIRDMDTTLILVCSQSGETMDIIKAIENIKHSGKITKIVGVVNVVNSQISQMVDCGVYMNVGREVSVASTKSYVSSLLVFFLIAEWMHQVNTSYTSSLDHIKQLITQIQKQTTDYDNVYERYELWRINKPSLFILGRGKFEPVAKECALKFKEVCYIHAEGCNAASLKHGPFALLTKDFPVILFIDKENRAKMMNTYEELVSRNAHVMIVTNDQIECKHVVRVPYNTDLPEVLFANLLQLFAYCIAVKNNIDPDRPRNLAKVVTVE